MAFFSKVRSALESKRGSRDNFWQDLLAVQLFTVVAWTRDDSVEDDESAFL